MASSAEEVLWRAYDSAASKLRSCLTLAQGGAKAEAQYAQAYAALAAAGLVQRLKGKYR